MTHVDKQLLLHLSDASLFYHVERPTCFKQTPAAKVVMLARKNIQKRTPAAEFTLGETSWMG